MTGKYLVECIAGRLRGHGLEVKVVEVADPPPPPPTPQWDLYPGCFGASPPHYRRGRPFKPWSGRPVNAKTGELASCCDEPPAPPAPPPTRVRLTARAGVAEALAESAEIRTARERLILLAVDRGFPAKSLVEARDHLRERSKANKVYSVSLDIDLEALEALKPCLFTAHVYAVTEKILTALGLSYAKRRLVRPEEAPLAATTAFCIHPDGASHQLPNQVWPLNININIVAKEGRVGDVLFEAHWMLDSDTLEERLVFFPRLPLPSPSTSVTPSPP